MPRWRASASRSEDGPVGGPVMVVAGSIRSPDEADALGVELSIADTEITMSADGTELGRWPAAAVGIRRLDSKGFEFVAEGDRLIFTPDDPATFGDSPFVGQPGADAGNGRGRRSKKKNSDDAEPRLAWYQDHPGEELGPPRQPVKESPKESPRKAPRRLRKATPEFAGTESSHRDIEPASSSTVTGPIDATLEAEQPGVDVASSNGRRRHKSRRKPPVTGPDIDDALPGEFGRTSNGVWIRVLDVARKYDAFGLDRVPIDQGLRGQEHQHTWDHRVAASSGLGKHICTICGAVRR